MDMFEFDIKTETINREKEGLSRKLNINELLNKNIIYDDKVLCLRLAENMTDYKDIYENWEYYDAHETYVIKLAMNYEPVKPIKAK